MKKSILNPLLVVVVCLVLFACKKSSSTAYGFTNIFMPQSINISGGIGAAYPVPTGTDSSTFNYTVDTVNKKVNVILGVARSGMQGADAFSVNVSTRTDTINQLITTGVLDATTILMPASMYQLPTNISVASGSTAATFNLSVDLANLKSTAYVGKKLALAVVISNPTKYQLAAGLTTTIVVIDVNALVIGPAVDITAKYLKNTGLPFVASSISSGARWGTLASWTANATALSHGGYGGWASDDGGTMDMESGWGSQAIYNGKIYQTTSSALPAGTYTYDASNIDWQGTLDPAYIVVAPSLDSVPDYSKIVGNTSISSTLFTAPKITFTLATAAKVTVGFVVNYIQDQQGFKMYSVKLLNYPKHL